VILGEVSEVSLIPPLYASLVLLLHADQRLEQRRLAHPVGPDDRHPLAAVDGEADIGEDDVFAVGLPHFPDL
jgi:hypothetical protein